MKKRILLVGLSIGAILLFSGCAGINPSEGTGENFGFFSGIWDGWTVLFAFIGKMFGAEMNIYEVTNNGNWYNFGFLLGVGSWGMASWLKSFFSEEDEKIKELEKEIKNLKKKHTTTDIS